MKLKITILFSLLFCVLSSRGIADTTGAKTESFVSVDQQIIDVKSNLEKLNKTIYVLDSLLKVNQLFANEKFRQLEKSISEQSTNFGNQIKSVFKIIEKIEGELSKSISSLDKNVSNNLSKIIIVTDSLKLNLDKNAKELDNAIVKANKQILTLDNYIEKVSTDSKNEIKLLDKTLGERTLYWILAILIVLIIVVFVFFFLKSKVSEQRDSLSSVKSTQEKLENEAIQLDTKLIQILEQKLEISNLQPIKEVDHSLPIKLGEEIHRMRKRLNTMEESQGTKVLNKRIESLEEKINDMGYEIVDLVGRSFDDGMELDKAQFIPDGNLKDGERIITRVIKPRITFNDEIIQHGDVVISQGD